MKKVYIIIFGLGVLIFVLFGLRSSKTEYSSFGKLLLPEKFIKKEAKILFVGDMNFDRYIRQMIDEKGGDFIFSCKGLDGMILGNFLKNADLVVGNLEGPITENQSVSLGSIVESPENYVFTFPPSTAKLLAKNNIKLVNLGNNHIGNFGMEGLDSTKKYLSLAQVNYFGGFGGDELIYRTEIGDKKISFISYNEFGIEPLDKIFEKIKTEKQNGQTVIVYAHWGDEYIAPPERIKNIAKIFAQNGTDFIIGSHPHVVLGNDILTNSGQEKSQTVVYYSLGNFIFDQYWNKEVSTGLVLELNIENDGFRLVEHRVSLSRTGQTCLVD